jgi:hypothetical protein
LGQLFYYLFVKDMRIFGIPDFDGNMIQLDNGFLPIAPSKKYIDFDAYQFNWGFEGMGTNQLAFALLLHFCGAEDAYLYHLAFKWDVLVHFKFNELLYLESDDVKTYVAWKKGQQTKLGRLYWKLLGRWRFSDLFYSSFIFPLERKEREVWEPEEDYLRYRKHNYLNLITES